MDVSVAAVIIIYKDFDSAFRTLFEVYFSQGIKLYHLLYRVSLKKILCLI